MKITCKCGSIVETKGYRKHLKTLKHQKSIEPSYNIDKEYLFNDYIDYINEFDDWKFKGEFSVRKLNYFLIQIQKNQIKLFNTKTFTFSLELNDYKSYEDFYKQIIKWYDFQNKIFMIYNIENFNKIVEKEYKKKIIKNTFNNITSILPVELVNIILNQV